MRKILLVMLPALLLVLGAVGGWYWWTDWRFLQSTDDAYVQSDVSLISPKIEGYIKEVRIRDNEAGAAGPRAFANSAPRLCPPTPPAPTPPPRPEGPPP